MLVETRLQRLLPVLLLSMETRIRVTGMTCTHCVATVAKALQKVPGVETANVNLENQQAVVTGSADTAALLAAIKEEGYEAELL